MVQDAQKPREIFMFNDIVVIAKPDGDKLKLLNLIPFNLLVAKAEDSDKFYEVEVHHVEKVVLTLKFDSKESRDVWYSDLKNTQAEINNQRQRSNLPITEETENLSLNSKSSLVPPSLPPKSRGDPSGSSSMAKGLFVDGAAPLVTPSPASRQLSASSCGLKAVEAGIKALTDKDVSLTKEPLNVPFSPIIINFGGPDSRAPNDSSSNEADYSTAAERPRKYASNERNDREIEEEVQLLSLPDANAAKSHELPEKLVLSNDKNVQSMREPSSNEGNIGPVLQQTIPSVAINEDLKDSPLIPTSNEANEKKMMQSPRKPLESQTKPHPNRPLKSATMVDMIKSGKPSHPVYQYVINISYISGEPAIIIRKFCEFFDFHLNLIGHFPDLCSPKTTLKSPKNAESTSGIEMKLPDFPVQMMFVSETVALQRMSQLQAYINKILGFPPKISRSPPVLKFFR